MTRQFKKLAHSLYECKYHVVFCPKYRYKILQDEVAQYVAQQIYRLCSQKDGVEVLEVRSVFGLAMHGDGFGRTSRYER